MGIFVPLRPFTGRVREVASTSTDGDRQGGGDATTVFTLGRKGPTAFLLGTGGNGKARLDQKFFLEKLMTHLLLPK